MNPPETPAGHERLILEQNITAEYLYSHLIPECITDIGLQWCLYVDITGLYSDIPFLSCITLEEHLSFYEISPHTYLAHPLLYSLPVYETLH